MLEVGYQPGYCVATGLLLQIDSHPSASYIDLKGLADVKVDRFDFCDAATDACHAP
jgi:hypothetical protein